MTEMQFQTALYVDGGFVLVGFLVGLFGRWSLFCELSGTALRLAGSVAFVCTVAVLVSLASWK